MTSSTPLTRDRSVDLDAAGAGPNVEQLLAPSLLDTAEYWYGLAATNAHTLRVALMILSTSRSGDLYRDDAIATIRKMRNEIAEDLRHAERIENETH